MPKYIWREETSPLWRVITANNKVLILLCMFVFSSKDVWIFGYVIHLVMLIPKIQNIRKQKVSKNTKHPKTKSIRKSKTSEKQKVSENPKHPKAKSIRKYKTSIYTRYPKIQNVSENTSNPRIRVGTKCKHTQQNENFIIGGNHPPY